ncbi:MAG: DUF4136 domain-containing protein [Kordiimonadaceae bacterium]|jgi:hypothetical protein|nr:DUF4136 domain-containing protein [Kordiimonadaceae bacterium]
MINLLKLCGSILILASLIACAPSVKSNVTRFHQLPAANGTSIEVIAMDPALQQSIEFGTYAQMVGQKLGAFGYSPASGQASNLIAEISYHIEPLRDTIIEDRSPVSIGVGMGSGRYGRRGGSSVGIGMSTSLGSSNQKIEYISSLQLNIVRLSDGSRLYEGRVENLGRNQNLQQVMPLLIDALFQNFPGESGTTNTIKHTTN